jgi:hypothetical protein
MKEPIHIFWRLFVMYPIYHQYDHSFFRIRLLVGKIGFCDAGYKVCRIAINNGFGEIK